MDATGGATNVSLYTDNAQEVKPADGPGEIDWDAYLNSYQFNEPTTASNKGNVEIGRAHV
jgi:hypothetical protein